MKILWSISHVGPDGFRRFSVPNQGRFHAATKADAEGNLKAMLSNNSTEKLASVFGPHFAATARADWLECYDHGDRMAGGKSSVGMEYSPDMDTQTKCPKERERIAGCLGD